MLNSKNPINGLKETGNIFGLNISFGDSLEIDKKDPNNITIPKGFENLEQNIGIGLALILKGIEGKNLNIVEDNICSKFELEQLLYISKLIYGSKKIEIDYFLTNTKRFTKPFFEFLRNILTETKLNIFLKNILDNVDDFGNVSLKEIYEIIYNQYLNFKIIENTKEQQKEQENQEQQEEKEKQESESIEQKVSNLGKEEEQDNENLEKNEENNPEEEGENTPEKILENTSSGVNEILELSDNLNELTKSAIKFVYDDAQDIIQYINNIEQKRKDDKARIQMSKNRKKTKHNLNEGNLKVTKDTLIKLSTGNPFIFEKKKNPKPIINKDIDTKIEKLALAGDISGSMGDLTGKWENPTKMDSLFLSIVLLTLISKELKDDFNINLFGDESIKIQEYFLEKNQLNPRFFNEIEKNIRREIPHSGKGNSSGVRDCLKSLETQKKGVGFVLSDGDSINNNQFFIEGGDGIKIINNNSNIVLLGYGLGKDASESVGYHKGKKVSVIGKQMIVGGNPRSKGYPLLEYKGVVKKIKNDLGDIMTQKKVILK